MRRRKPLPAIRDGGKETPTQEGQAEPVLIELGDGDSHDGEGWELVTSGTRRTAPTPPADLHLQNWASALVAGRGLGAVSHKAPAPAKPEPCSSSRREQQLRGVDNSLLPTQPGI